MSRARTLFTQVQEFKSGFKFDHVWDMMKDFEKYQDNDRASQEAYMFSSGNYVTSEAEVPTPDGGNQSSPSLSEFNLNASPSAGGSS